MDWNEDYFVSPSTIFASLSSDWQQHILASSSYLELGMFDDAALALEEIKPEGKTRTEVLSARVVLYLVAQQWDMPAAVANHLVKVEPGNSGWRINLAYATRRCEGVEKAEKILLPARKLHHDNAMILGSCSATVRQRDHAARPTNSTISRSHSSAQDNAS